MDFFFQNNSVENSLICHKDKSAKHCPIEIFPIYQKKHWTIRRWDDHIVVQTSRRNIFKIDGFKMKNLSTEIHILILSIKSTHQLFPWLELLSKFLLYLEFHNIKSTGEICEVEKYW